MNINASNNSLINILLQQATKTQEKKRPTFAEVFAKLNARTARMDANKNPMNNRMTNEQLFRYYIRDTDPKLQVSNETFSSEDTFNPMKDKDTSKIYGRSTTQTSDIIPSIDPSNYRPNVGEPDAIIPSAPTAPTAPTAPSAPLPTPSPYTEDEQNAIDEGEMYIDAGNTFLEYFNNIDMNSLSENTKEFLNVIFYKNTSDADWSELGAYMFDRINNTFETNEIVSDLYKAMIAFSAMPEGLIRDYIPYTILRLTSTNANPTREDMDAILKENELKLRKRFYDHKNDEKVGLRLPDGTYDKQMRAYGEQEYGRYKLDVLDPIDAITTNFIADYQARIKFIKTGEDFARDEGAGNPRLLEVQQARAIGDFVANVIQNMMRDLFNDDDTEMRTNTNINSVILDEQIVSGIRGREQDISELLASLAPPKLSTEDIISPSSTNTEAGSAEVAIDNAIMKRGVGRPAGRKNNETLRKEQEQGLRSLNLMEQSKPPK